MEKNWLKLKKNPQLFRTYFIREQILSLIRTFFINRGFHDVEVPLLAPCLIPESYLEVFETTMLNRHRKVIGPAYLTPSPEIFLKKLLVAGIGNCFSLTKSFRNTEDMSTLHNHEFTMLEWYRVDADYMDLLKDSEELFRFFAQKIKRNINSHPDKDKIIITYQGKTIDLTPPWEKITMVEAFKKYAKMDLKKALTLESISPIARQKGYSVSEKDTWEQLFHQIYLNEVEPQFGKGRPTVIYEFPSHMAALARKKPDDSRFAERFEIFVEGLELGDAYSELTDWKEQETRFRAETEERKRLGKIEHPYDQDFLEALKVGLPKCTGLALGVDRLIMLFADVATIQETLFFPVSEMWTSS